MEGLNISIDVTFSEDVIVTESPPSLELNNTATASFDSMLMNDVIRFSYVVASLEDILTLDVSSISATIIDEAGNDADLTLPASNNLADNHSIHIDTTPPAVDAGADFTISEATPIVASASDAGSGIATIAWTQESGSGTVSFLPSANVEQPTVAADAEDDYTLRLTVTDNAGNLASDTVLMTWEESGGGGTGGSGPLLAIVGPSGDFGSATIDGSDGKLKSFAITNTSDEATSSAPSISLSAATADFSIVDNKCVSALAVGESCLVNVKFHPTSASPPSVSLEATYDGNTASSALSGSGTSPGVIQINHNNELNFGAHQGLFDCHANFEGACPPSRRSFEVHNTSGIDLSDFYVSLSGSCTKVSLVSNAFGGSPARDCATSSIDRALKNNQRCLVTVEVTGDAISSCSVFFDYNESASVNTSLATVAVSVPTISGSNNFQNAVALHFGTANEDVDLTFAVRGTSNAYGGTQAHSDTSGLSVPFSPQSNSCLSGTILVNNGKCNTVVRMTANATSPGLYHSNFFHNNPGTTWNISVTGFVSGSNIKLSDSTLDFQYVPTNQSAYRSFSIVNTGTEDITPSVNTAGLDAAISVLPTTAGCTLDSTVLSPGEVCFITVAINSSIKKDFRGDLAESIEITDFGTSFDPVKNVNIEGAVFTGDHFFVVTENNSVVCDELSDPCSTYNFGGTSPDDPKTRVFNIKNWGIKDAPNFSVVLLGSMTGAGQHFDVVSNGCASTLEALGDCNVSISFSVDEDDGEINAGELAFNASIEVRLDGTAERTVVLKGHEQNFNWKEEPLSVSSGVFAENTPDAHALAHANDGTAMFVFIAGGLVYYSKYEEGSWSTHSSITSLATAIPRLRLVGDGEGNYMAVWHHSDWAVYTSYFDSSAGPSGSWGTSAPIHDTNSTQVPLPAVDMNASGQAIVAWRQQTFAEGSRIFYRYFEDGSWSGLAAPITAGGETHPFVAIDDDGNAWAVYRDFTPDPDQWRSSYYNKSSEEWVHDAGDHNGLLINGFTPLATPVLVSHGVGNFLVSFEGENQNIEVKRYTHSTGMLTSWGNSNYFNLDSSTIWRPNVGFDSMGNSILVWFEQPLGSTVQVMASRLVSGAAHWSSPERIDDSTAHANSALPPSIAFDGQSNGIVSWAQFPSGEPQRAVYLAHYISGSGWDASKREIIFQQQEAPDAQDHRLPGVAMDLDGRIFAVWRSANDAEYLSNVYD